MDSFDVELAGEDDWEPLVIPTSFGHGRSFVSGDPEGDRLRLRFFRAPANDSLLARVWFGPGAEGPPFRAHGGSAAAVLDEVMGTACWMTGHPVLAARLTVDFRASVPLGEVHTAEAWVARTEGRKVHVVGNLRGADGTVFTEGEGLFVELAPERYEAFKKSGLQRPGGDFFGTLTRRAAT